jgi:hypothetical protein
MAVYHNIGSSSGGRVASATDSLRKLLATIRKDPNLLRSAETMESLALEIRKKLHSLVLAGDAEVDITITFPKTTFTGRKTTLSHVSLLEHRHT